MSPALPTTARVTRALLLAVALLAGGLSALMAYGYWHVNAHGWLHFAARDHRERSAPRPITSTGISLLDDAGTELARLVTDERHGVGFIASPKEYICDSPRGPSMPHQERLACLRKQARWVMTWARKARYARLGLGACSFSALPVAVGEYTESWLIWWVPLPHVFGRPYTLFNISLDVDGGTCSPASLR
jgi:hypothetical protein